MTAQGKGADHLVAQAIAARYPKLNSYQCSNLAQAILREIAAKVVSGSELAILEPLPDGSFEINRMVVERIERVLNDG